MNQQTPRQGSILACDEKTYAITLDPNGHLFLDDQETHLVVETLAHLSLVTSTMSIRCTTDAFWCAFAGTDAVSTNEESGYWLAQTFVRQEQLADWKARCEAMMLHMAEMLSPALPTMMLPQSRLDAFTEACLARCDEHPTLAQVQALATLLQQDIETVRRWLDERGKAVLVPSVPVASYATTTSPSTSNAQEDHEHEVSLEIGTENVSDYQASSTHMAPPRQASARSKPGQFKWTDERVALLRAAFAALPASAQYSRYAAAATIARQYNWPRQSVEYKLYALFPRFIDEAELGVEVLHPGSFLWDVQLPCEGESPRHERWGLDYPLGSFPYALGSLVKYRGQRYEVQQAHSNLLVMRPLLQQQRETPETENQQELVLA